MPTDEETQKITESLYQHNLELTVKNRTLSLLEKLYQTSVLSLSPEETARVISDTIREDLNLEFTGIFNFNKRKDTLTPLAFSKSERLLDTLHKLGFMFMDIKIKDVSKQAFLQKVAYKQSADMTSELEAIWGDSIKTQYLREIKEESHIKTIILYPLITGGNVFQELILGLNRDYDTLNNFEKSSIPALINVVTLSLNRAYLYRDLQDANTSLRNLIKQRESFVHLINHKIKGAFTHSKYIFAEMLAGSFGTISDSLKTKAEQGLDSDNLGIATIDLILNVSNLENGTIKFEMKKINLKEVVLKTIEDKRGPAETKGLKVETDIKDGDYFVSGDEVWLKEVAHNLIENAIRYTKEGQITVGLERKDAKILLYVKDTGVGIPEEDKGILFTEGGRGKSALKVNVDSTGYGLFSVKLIVEAHKGKVWAESEVGKGSTFFVELDAVE